jgi:hypothetical protein
VKHFGDKMEAGDPVTVYGWAYAVSTRRVANAAHMMLAGSAAHIERVVDRNAVVVRFANGCCAPVHPSVIYPSVSP